MHPLSVAPMMDRTDRHFRYLLRSITRRTLLYSEMITAAAVVRGRPALLAYDPAEHPVALQLGGDDPQLLAAAAQKGADLGYDEINLNVGCPSERVQSGRFGACLMAHPALVAECVTQIKAKVKIPVTVKHRIGIDDLDRYEDMLHFVDIVAQSGVARFSVHARKAWLNGLSPKENRTIPPLRYDDVYRLKKDRPHLVVEINGGIQNLAEAQNHLQRVDAVMIGRAAYDRPMLFADADRLIYGELGRPVDPLTVLEQMIPYAEKMIAQGHRLASVSRHMLEIMAGRPGAKAYKRYLSENAHRAGAGTEVLKDLLTLMRGYKVGSPAGPTTQA